MTDSGDPRRESEAVESTRGLAGARYGIVSTVDKAGAHADHVRLSGFNEQEQRERAARQNGERMFAHLCSVPGPLRVDDCASYPRSVGLEPLPSFGHAFMAAPMRHRGERVGMFFRFRPVVVTMQDLAPFELAVGEGRLAGLGEGDEPGGAEPELAASSADDEPPT